MKPVSYDTAVAVAERFMENAEHVVVGVYDERYLRLDFSNVIVTPYSVTVMTQNGRWQAYPTIDTLLRESAEDLGFRKHKTEISAAGDYIRVAGPGLGIIGRMIPALGNLFPQREVLNLDVI